MPLGPLHFFFGRGSAGPGRASPISPAPLMPSIPVMKLAKERKRAFAVHSIFHTSFGSAGLGGNEKFSSGPKAFMLPNIIPPAAVLASVGIAQLVCVGGMMFFNAICFCTSAGDSQSVPMPESRLLADVHITMSPPCPARSIPPMANAE